MVLPIKFGLVGPNGHDMTWTGVAGGTVEGDLIVMDSPSLDLTFTGIANRPVPSLFRGFSAPVKISSDASAADQLFLARHDTDPFNLRQALQDASLDILVKAVRGETWTEGNLDNVAAALAETARSPGLDAAFKANALQLPQESVIARALGSDIDPDRIREIRRALPCRRRSPQWRTVARNLPCRCRRPGLLTRFRAGGATAAAQRGARPDGGWRCCRSGGTGARAI